MSSIEEIKSKLQAFKKRYYVRKFLIGSLLFLISSSLLFLLVNGLEYNFWLGTSARSILFFSSILVLLSLFAFLIVNPLIYLFKLRNGLSDQEAAQEIAKSFPEIQDKLLNTLQLYKLSDHDNDLLTAAIDKKAFTFKNILFTKAVDFTLGKKYAGILGGVFLCLALVSFINPSIFTESTERIVKYNQEFTPKAPFSFLVEQELFAFKGEDFTLNVQIEGNSVPEALVMHVGERKIRMQNLNGSVFQYTFSKVQREIKFQIEGSGYYSNQFHLKVNERPNLIAMNITIQSPSYTGGDRRVVANTGDITVLEGSSVSWDIITQASDSINFLLNGDKVENSRAEENSFSVNQRLFNSSPYTIELFNQFGKNASEIDYNIGIIKDEKPAISVEYFPDSTSYRFITLAGNVIDDHGFTKLELKYKQEGKNQKSIALEINKGVRNQSFYANWNVDSLGLQPGERLEFYISVSDNDQVNGAKTSRSRTFFMEIPSDDQIDEIIEEKSQLVENQIDKSQSKAEEISERLEKIEEKLKAEQKFDWQEKKELSDIIEDREELEKQIQELQKQHEELQRSSDQFNKRSEQSQKQNEKLQSLLNELLDEKTKELYEQLKELLKDKDTNSDDVRQQLEDIQKNEKNLERELDRALELFKRLKMESALEQNLQMLDSLSEKQSELANDPTKSEEQDMEEQQKQIQEEFNEFREKMDEVEKLNQELKRPEAIQDFELEERQIAKELREIQEQMDQNQEGENQESGSEQQEPNEQKESEEQGEQSEQEKKENSDQQQQKSGSKQKQQSKQIQQKQNKASQRMKQLSKQLNNMQSGMQMEMMQANLDQLRDILDNLVKLSFNQEELMTEMRQVSQSDPRFLELSQAQLKLKDDAKVIQDSLLSLAKRVVQISAFITREVGNINENVDESLGYLKDRNRNRALSSQQFAMTSINNLALLLDDTMQQMQMAMSEAMGNPGKGQEKQKGLPDLQQMQQQLGQNMNELKGSGKQGRELSEELARLAAQQEMIRRQLEMIREAQDGQPGGSGNGDDLQKAIDQMEQNEVDLVNKRLTQQLINRQKNIETRLLQAEKAQREQELEEEREAESPSVFSREIPPQFEEYLKLKQKEIELLKTIPVELNPFYKKEVNDYFRRISSDDKNDR